MSVNPRRYVMRLYELVTGRRFLTHLDQLERSQWLSRNELLRLQGHKLHQMLAYAYQYVPYYRRIFDQVGFKPDEVLTDPAALRKVPVLTKPIIRSHFDELLTTETGPRSQLRQLSTSGSTGQPLKFMQDTNFRDYFTAAVHHHLAWGGWRFGQPHAYIGGASFEITAGQSLRDRLMDWTLNRFSINAYALTEESMHDFARQVRRRRPTLLYGYASSLYYFAQFVNRHNFDDLNFQSVFSSAEVLYPDQRCLIEETFECHVFDRYATREVGEIGSQCAAQTGLHLSLENVYVELVDHEGRPTGPGEAGNVIVTNLTNFGMPFVRYNLADVAAWHPEHHCPCGRAHPMLSLVEGRHNDMFRAGDGRIVWGGIGNPLWDIDGVKQFQLVQKRYDLVVVRVVKEDGLTAAEKARVEKAIRHALGDTVQTRFEFPTEIPVEKSGKYRYQICEIEPAAVVSRGQREADYA